MQLVYGYQEWPYRKVFRISREAKDFSDLFVVHLIDGELIGRGECGVLPQYGHTKEDLVEAFEEVRHDIHKLKFGDDLRGLIDNSSVRNAVDCALWDLECKRRGKSVWQLAGVPVADRLEVDISIGIDTPERMSEDARRAASHGYRLIKLKAGADGIVEGVRTIAEAVPDVSFIVDANEAWSLEQLSQVVGDLHRLGVLLIEQPLPHTGDQGLEGFESPIPLCADESCRDVDDIDRLSKLYQSINIKLDKVGGLTAGLELARAAKERGMQIMLGCNGATSLGIAPAYVLGSMADVRDLDSPALLFGDRQYAMTYSNGHLNGFDDRLWGGPDML